METILPIIVGFLIVVTTVVFALWFSAFVVTFRSVQKARQMFTEIKTRQFYRNGDHIYSHRADQQDDGFIWFTQSDDFCLDGTHYLHNQNYTYWSVWGNIWLKRYCRWFHENVNPTTLPKW